MIRNILLLLIFFTVTIAVAAPAKFYIVNRSLLTGTRQITYDNFMNGGRQSDSQPVFITQQIQPANTSYYLIGITTITSAENSNVLNLIGIGVINFVYQIEIENIYDYESGGLITKSKRTNFNVFPSDIDKNWVLEVSTP